jgi:hypothetical protein
VVFARFFCNDEKKNLKSVHKSVDNADAVIHGLFSIPPSREEELNSKCLSFHFVLFILRKCRNSRAALQCCRCRHATDWALSPCIQ